jgi:hypothetical protein
VKRLEAAGWLRERLTRGLEGPLRQEAEAAAWSWITIRRALRHRGVERAVPLNRSFPLAPDVEQRRILNGWSSYTEREGKTPDETRDYFRALHATVDKRGIVAAGHDVYHLGGTDPVHVFVREGATRSETLQALRGITAILADRWGVMIDHHRLHSEGFVVGDAFEKAVARTPLTPLAGNKAANIFQ